MGVARQHAWYLEYLLGGFRKESFGGLFERYARVTRPARGFETGLSRLGWDAGRYGGPPLGVYLAGRYAGMWGPNSKGLEEFAPETPEFSMPTPLGPGRGGVPFKTSAPTRTGSPPHAPVSTLYRERPRIHRPPR